MKEKYEAVMEENKKLKTKVKVYLVFLYSSILYNKKNILILRIEITFFH